MIDRINWIFFQKHKHKQLLNMHNFSSAQQHFSTKIIVHFSLLFLPRPINQNDLCSILLLFPALYLSFTYQ